MNETLDRTGQAFPRRGFFIVHNPNSGQEARRFYVAVLSHLRSSGANIEVVETASHGQGMVVARAAAQSGQFDAVVAAGGDGTIHDVAEGLLDQAPPLGIILAGTANVFARA